MNYHFVEEPFYFFFSCQKSLILTRSTNETRKAILSLHYLQKLRLHLLEMATLLVGYAKYFEYVNLIDRYKKHLSQYGKEALNNEVSRQKNLSSESSINMVLYFVKSFTPRN